MTLLAPEAVTVSLVNGELGALVQGRRTRLGMSVSALARAAKVDRGRLSALEAGDDTVQDRTIGAVMSALDRLEQEMGMESPVGSEEGLVEFVVEGNFGVRAVVKGPVRDMEKLQEAVAQLVREMRGEDAP